MASRHLKRMQEAKELAQAPEVPLADSEREEEEDEEGQAGIKPFNPFDLLSDDEADGADDDTAPYSEDDSAGPAPAAPAPGQAVLSSAVDRKGGKKKKKGGKARGGGGDEADAGPTSDGDDIDRLVQELNLKTVGAAGAAAAAELEKAGPLLGVDLHSLRGDDELRRIFGSDVVHSVDREEGGADHGGGGEALLGGGGAGGRRRGVAQQARGSAAPRRRPLKRGALVTPRDHWPAFEGGLSMQFVGMKEGKQLYRYVYSQNYRGTQRMFEECQASYDPNSILTLLRQAPYHVDSLLAMCDLYRHMADNAAAEDCLNRALYALEAGWHTGFNIASGTCRLDYEVDENVALFSALFRHAQALSRQGCHRTALEVCKLLLALSSPDDPLGALCMVDYLALRAGQYAFLRRFVSEWDGSQSLALLPSYAHATALAAFRQEQERERLAAAAEARQGSSGQASTSAAAKGGGGGGGGGGSGGGGGGASSEGPVAHELLVQALLLQPLVLPHVVAKLQEKGSAREAAWAQLLTRRPFRDAHDGGSTSLSHLVSIYVERSHLLWKAPDALEFLLRGAAAAADLAEGRGQQAEGLVMDADDWAAVRHEAFPASDKNDFRHLRLHDFTDNVSALPREELNAAMAAGGLPEVEDQLEELQQHLLLQAQEAHLRGGGGTVGAAAGAVGGAAAMTEEELRAANPLMLLLRSLLPWVDAGPQYGPDGALLPAPPAPPAPPEGPN